MGVHGRMCVCMGVCMYVRVYVCACVYLCMYVGMHVFVCECMYVRVRGDGHVRVRVRVRVHVHCSTQHGKWVRGSNCGDTGERSGALPSPLAEANEKGATVPVGQFEFEFSLD